MTFVQVARRGMILLALGLVAACARTPSPTSWMPTSPLETRTQTITLKTNDQTTTVRAILPVGRSGALPVLLFSHGAGLAPERYDRLMIDWAAQGFAVLAPLHIDAPEHPGNKTADRMRTWLPRLADMRALLDGLADVETATGVRLDRTRVAAAGHSYGALVAQALGGAKTTALGGDGQIINAREAKVLAVVAFSPPGPLPGFVTPQGWSAVAVPMMVQTGTKDVLPMIAPKWEDHIVSYLEAPAGGKLLFVGEGVDHYFGNVFGRTEFPGPPANEAYAAAMATSIAFLDAHVRGDIAARAWLDRKEPVARWGSAIHRYEVK
jgi:poly(3-hydroxybutyrate) depolymerase